MVNLFKSGTSITNGCIYKKNFTIGVNSSYDYGPTSTTSFYNGVTNPTSGYTVYQNKITQGPSIRTAANDSEMVTVLNSIGFTGGTTLSALVWAAQQSDIMVTNMDYPSITTSSLILNLDAGYVSSYPTGGTVWYDLSPNSYTATLAGFSNSAPTYSISGGGSILLTRVSPTQGNSVIWSLSTSGTPWADLTTAVSLSVWFNNNASTVGIIAGKGFQTSPILEYQSYQIYTNGTNVVGRITASGVTNNTDISTTFSLNTWTNITLTYDGTTMVLYKNGVSAATSAKTGLMTNVYSFPFVVGGSWHGGVGLNKPTDFFPGNIGQTLLYSRALSSIEVLNNFNVTKSRYGL